MYNCDEVLSNDHPAGISALLQFALGPAGLSVIFNLIGVFALLLCALRLFPLVLYSIGWIIAKLLIAMLGPEGVEEFVKKGE